MFILAYNILMLSRDKNIRAIERFIFSHHKSNYAAANAVSDIVGVIIGIKTAAQGDFSGDSVDSKSLWRFTKLLEKKRLCIIFEKHVFDGRTLFYYYVARSHKRAAELQATFNKLWTDVENCSEYEKQIGELLGYPKTAIRYYIHNCSGDSLSKNHLARSERNRFYAHSATHELAEFQQYELPIYNYLSKHCPRTAKLYRAETKKHWLD